MHPVILFCRQHRQQYAVKDKLMEEIDQLDPDDRHYQHRKSDLDDRLYKMYDKIDDTEELLIEARAKKQAIEADKVTRENIVGILTNFQRLYDVMNDAEKHDLMETLIADIQVYPQRQPNGQWLKSIHFKLPIIPEEEMQFGLDISDRDETVMSLVQQKPDDIVKVGIDADDLAVTKAESKATYGEIQARVKEQTGLNVTPLYIAQVKRKHGIIERECYNKAKSESAKMLICPPDKEKAIEDALRFFGMIA